MREADGQGASASGKRPCSLVEAALGPSGTVTDDTHDDTPCGGHGS